MEIDDQTSFAFPPPNQDLNAGSEVLGESSLEIIELRSRAILSSWHHSGRRQGRWGEEPANLGLEASNRPLAVDHGLGKRLADGDVSDCQQHLGVPLTEVPSRHQGCRGGIEIEQSKQVGDGCPFQADPFRCLLVGQGELANQPIDPLGSLQRIQVFPLKVLDQRPLGRLAIIERAQYGGYPIESQRRGGAESTLPGHKFVPGRHPPNDDRLHESVLADRVNEGLHGDLAESLPRLPRISSDLGRTEHQQRVLRLDCLDA